VGFEIVAVCNHGLPIARCGPYYDASLFGAVVMPDISQQRWSQAQALENFHWQGARVSMLIKAAGLFASYVDMLGAERCATLFDGKNLLDVGSGPWGLNVAALYPHADRIKRWTVAEPLPRIPVQSMASEGEWADGFLEWMTARLARLEYMQVSGESLPFEATFDTVTCINVLDHVRQPAEILRSIGRALRPGGRLLLGVDCLSVLGQIKFDWYLRRRYPNEFIVGAHPFTFRVPQIRALLQESGFTLDEVIGAPSRGSAIYGRSHHPFFLCHI